MVLPMVHPKEGKAMIPRPSLDQPFIHPACPRKLKSAFRKAKYKVRTLAKARGINIYYVSRAIRFGERPANVNIAKALFFSREYKRREGEPQPEPPRHIRWWRQLSPSERSARILDQWAQTHLGEKP